MKNEIDEEDVRPNSRGVNIMPEAENRFLIMDFWEFAITSTLMAVFFPWSLLYCLIFHGMQETKYLVIALAHDWIKTIYAILAILVPLIIAIVILVVWLSK